MIEYILSKSTAQKMLDTWFSSGLSLGDTINIYSVFNMFTVFDPSSADSTRSLKELTASDVVRFHVTPRDLVEQEDIVPYGQVLATIIDIGSGRPIFSPSDNPLQTIITFH